VALDPIAFQKTYVYEARAPVAEVLADLTTLGGMDARAERKRRALWWSAWGLLAVGVFNLFFGGLIPGDGGLQFPVVLGGVLGSVALFIVRWSIRRSDLEDRRYGLVARLLQRFEVDLDPNVPVEVRMDLAPPDEKHKLVGKGQRGRWKCEDFTDAWLSLQGRFVNGTSVHLSMVDHLQKRSRSKTNARGKTKTKTKRKGKSLLQVHLRVKPERYPGLANLEKRARAAVRLPKDVPLKRLEVSEDRLAMRTQLGHDWVHEAPKPAPGKAVVPPAGHDASRTVTMMLLSLSQVLGSTRRPPQQGKMRATP
jgi:hypothetical protein